MMPIIEPWWLCEFDYNNCKLSDVINVLQNMAREHMSLEQRNHITLQSYGVRFSSARGLDRAGVGVLPNMPLVCSPSSSTRAPCVGALMYRLQ